MSLGAARAGYSVLCAVENDPHAIEAHSLNFPNTNHINKDISCLNGRKIMAELNVGPEEIAGIIGGPPCQGFSIMGRGDITDPRNNLFVDFFRIVSEIKPKFFLAENVPGILNEKNRGIREQAKAYVERFYKLLEPITVCAKDYGVPTTRTRVFFIGFLEDEIDALRKNNFQPAPNVGLVNVSQALRGLPTKIDAKWQTEVDGWRKVSVMHDGYFSFRLRGFVPNGVGNQRALVRLRKESKVSGCLGTRHSEVVSRRYAQIPHGKSDPISKSYRLDPNGFCPTIRAGTGSDRGSFQAVRPLHPFQARVITPREAARLQGFPDWYQFSPTKWHSFRQIGNSVSPIVAEQILSKIMKAITK